MAAAGYTFTALAQGIACAALLALLLNALYNRYFHPLACFPGPPLWTASRLPFAVNMIRGVWVHKIRAFHQHYGPIVRIAPDELSFADPVAWRDIHQRHASEGGHFTKDPIFMGKPESHPTESIVTVVDLEKHARMRRVLERSFTGKAIRSQEPIVQRNIDRLVERLRDVIRDGEADEEGRKVATTDMIDWFAFCTFDLTGDLAFGETFGCLDTGKYHRWVSICTDSIRGFTIATACKYYPALDWLLQRLIPQSLREQEYYHYAHTVEKVQRRLGLEKQRMDFMTPFVEAKDKPGAERMSMDEIFCSFGFLIIAGSETTTVTMAGITNYLVQNTDVLRELEDEVRARYQSDVEITMDSLKELEYLDAVVKEGMRLCNAIPAGIPRIVSDSGTTICGQYVPGKTRVAVNSLTLHTSSEHFTDPHAFLPSRWLKYRPATITKHNSSAINPFGIGYRKCLGYELALLEMRLMLAKLVWNFDLEMEPGSVLKWGDLRIFFGIEHKPVLVRLKERVR